MGLHHPEDVLQESEKGARGAANASKGIVRAFGRPTSKATVDGRPGSPIWAFIIPGCWMGCVEAYGDKRLLYAAATVVMSLHVKSYAVCLGTAICWGMCAGRNGFGWVGGILIGLAGYVLLGSLAYHPKTRLFARLLAAGGMALSLYLASA